jgi:hypothetical protein
MKLKRTGIAPHRGQGPRGRAVERAPLSAGAHLTQRDHSGFSDAKGYQSRPAVSLGQRQAGRAPTVPREAGHYHPIDTRVSQGGTRGLMGDVSDTRAMNAPMSATAFLRQNGRHSGKGAQGDTGKVRGPAVGNTHGTPAPGIGKGPGVRGSMDSHLGDAGRGAPGKLGRGDAWKGKAKSMSEDISHDAFERLGAD